MLRKRQTFSGLAGPGYRFAQPATLLEAYAMSNPWDRPHPLPERGGAKSPEPVFQAVGRALSHWELVEQALAQLYIFLTTGRHKDFTDPAIRAFGSIVGVKARIAMVRAASESWFERYPDCPLSENCRLALWKCSEWSSRRNDVAHGRVSSAPYNANSWMLYPGLFTTKYSIKGKPKYVFRVEDMDRYSEGFKSLWEEMNILSSSLAVWRLANAGKRPKPPS
jgi:hypothetical protein